ncbi:MAG: DUF4912 domain-containing protein [Candidatus Omnitrophica bacterium]|nr:DUF4912 domain-containing protein [Candidatus Omnitrophota bacterium]
MVNPTSSQESFSSDGLSRSTAPEVAPRIERKYHVPNGYNDNKVVLLIRDPWTLFSFWEIKKDIEDKVRDQIRQKGLIPEKLILRVYDVTGKDPSEGVAPAFDFEVREWVNTWYVHTGNHGRSWMVDVGILCTNGEFFCLARSNVVTAPTYGMSESTDEQWKCPEELYYKMFAVAGGWNVGKSSLMVKEEFVKEKMERHLKEWLFSGERAVGLGIGVSSGMFGSASFHLFRK